MRRRRAALMLLALLTACGTASAQPTPTPVTVSPPTEAPLRPPAVNLPEGASVFEIVMENRSASEALAQPYLSTLAHRHALATNYRAVAHPSLPNYLALTSGSTFGITDDAYHGLPAGGLGAELTSHGVTWRAYMEGMTGDCLSDHARYAVKHNPFVYYGGACPDSVVPFDTLASDLASGTPRFVWITPDLCHDAHDCSTRAGDDFLRGLVPEILASPAWTRGGVLFITWDEDDGSAGNKVATIVASPNLKAHETARPYTHYSLLATVQDLLAVPRLGLATQAQAMDDLL